MAKEKPKPEIKEKVDKPFQLLAEIIRKEEEKK